MLHFAGWIAFGVNVRNLFQLQRAFERHRKIYAATEIQKIGRPKEFLGEFLDAVRIVEQVFEFDRKFREFLCVEASLIYRKHAAELAQVQAEQVKRDHLPGE